MVFKSKLGPTETTIFNTLQVVKDNATSSRNIGKPFGSNITFIMGKNNSINPIGCVGELFIAGKQLASGYFMDPEKTKQVFIEEPIRMYRTGDLAMITDDGDIFMIGRKDNQIKLHGFRIEIDEIQKMAIACDGVKNAVVKLIGEGQRCRLVCFLMFLRNDSNRLVSLVEARLRNTLPHYMIPKQWIVLSEIPKTANGKTDMKALERLALNQSQNVRYRDPNTPMEKLIFDAIAEVTGKNHVNLEDSFFSNGGDSILAIRLVSRLRQSQHDLDLSLLFGSLTLSQLSTRINVCLKVLPDFYKPFSLLPEKYKSELITKLCNLGIKENEIEDIYPMTNLQKGLLFSSFQNSSSYRTKLIYKLPTGTNYDAFKDSIEKVVRQNAIFRTTFAFLDCENPKFGAIQAVLNRAIEWFKYQTTEELILYASQQKIARPGNLFVRLCLSADVSEFAILIHHALYDGQTFDQVIFVDLVLERC